MRFIALATLFFMLLLGRTYAQHDSSGLRHNDTSLGSGRKGHVHFLDSVAQTIQARQAFVSDSLLTQYITPADPLRHNLLIDSLFNKYLYKGSNNFIDATPPSKSILREGHLRQTRDQWVIVVIIGLLLYTAILNRAMSKDMGSVWHAFYSKRMLSQVSKDDSIINAWTFIGLFLLFGLTFGLFLYQIAQYYHVYYSISGVRLFVSLSLIILVLFAIKYIIVRFLGFVFNVSKLVNEYLSVLYLTYFNITFVFLPLTVCFGLLPNLLIPYVLLVAIILIVIIFIWQYLRSSVNIISNILFHKFYLIVYLCALEICPILILIKALNI